MTMGAFHSCKTFEHLETAANGQMVQKLFRNCWISKMWTIQPKILEIPGAKLNKKKKMWVYLARLSSFWKFWKILFHSLLPESRRKFKPDVLVEWKTPKVNWRDLSRVGPIGPSNYICAKKKWTKFRKVLCV